MGEGSGHSPYSLKKENVSGCISTNTTAAPFLFFCLAVFLKKTHSKQAKSVHAVPNLVDHITF